MSTASALATKKAQLEALSKIPKAQGTVIKHKGGKAQVLMPNGDKRWFTMDNDAEREAFAIGAKLEFAKIQMPTDRESLFDAIKLIYPDVKYGVSVVTWTEGKNEAVLIGQALILSEKLSVFCSPEATMPGPGNGKRKGFAIVEGNILNPFEFEIRDYETALGYLAQKLQK